MNPSELDCLILAHKKFKKCSQRIIKSEIPNAGDINKLESYLNQAQPTDSREKAWKKMIRFFGQDDVFVAYLCEKYPYFSLWLDAKKIMKLYKLENKINIHWTGDDYQIFVHRNYII